MAESLNVDGTPSVSEAMLPPEIVSDIIQTAPKSSAVLSHARRATMSTQKSTQPVLTSLPDAFWINGRTGSMQVSEAEWGNKNITAEDLGVIVPISNTLIDDVNVPLWDQVKPLIAEAIGKKVDGASLFGNDKPESWPDAVVPAAIAKGNTIAMGTYGDLAADVAALGEKIALQGCGINGFATPPGMNWRLMGLRDKNDHPIFFTNLSDGKPVSSLYGFPMDAIENGAWDSTKAELLGVDWNKLVVGIRQDITYDIYREGVISNAEGKVIINLMQQRMTALVVTARIGFQVADCVNPLGNGYPAGVILPASEAKASAFDPNGDTPPTSKQTNDQIAAWAQAHDISLTGCTTKDQMLAAISAALEESGN